MLEQAPGDLSAERRRARPIDKARYVMSLKDECDEDAYYHFETSVAKWIREND